MIHPLARHYNFLYYLVANPRIQFHLRRFATGTLVDIGCGSKPYAAFLEPLVDEHIGVDVAASPHGTSMVDVVADAYDTTLADGSADSVLCTDVLEHLEEPSAAMEEIARILRPGGHVIITVPMVWHIHEAPRDFYRFTEYGLDHIIKRAGLVPVTIVPLTGFVVTAAQQLSYFLAYKRPRSRFNPLAWATAALIVCVQLVAYFVSHVDTHSSEFTTEYLAVARRGEAA